jgi:hypothetical protein
MRKVKKEDDGGGAPKQPRISKALRQRQWISHSNRTSFLHHDGSRCLQASATVQLSKKVEKTLEGV